MRMLSFPPASPARLYGLVALCVLSLAISAHSVSVQSSTFEYQKFSIVGNTFEYAVMETQFDDELYLMSQWTCACVQNSSVTCVDPAAYSTAVVNETGYYLLPLQEGVWTEAVITNDLDGAYYKFVVDYDPLIPCPIIAFDFQNVIGTLAVFISTTGIPNSQQRTWANPYYGYHTYSICPSNPNFSYGAYYVSLGNQFGNVYNQYRLRYRIVNSPVCTASSPSPSPTQEVVQVAENSFEWNVPADDIDSVWLVDGYEHQDSIDGGAFMYYRFMAPGPCTNVSISGYVWDGTADVDLFVSATHPYPTLHDKSTYSWHGTMDGDDTANYYYCKPSSTATNNTFFIGIHGATPGTYNFSVFATSLQWDPPKALSTFSFIQSQYALSYGAAPTLSCADRPYGCGFSNYGACDIDVNYDCCYLFSPLAPASFAQPVWPWSEWDLTIGALAYSIPWHPTADFALVPGKLAWRLYMSRSTDLSDGTGLNQTLSISDPASCTLTLNTNLVDRSGKPVTDVLSFAPKPKTCDYDALQEIQSEIENISASLIGQTDIAQLGLAQTFLLFASLNSSYTACHEFTSNFTNVVQALSPMELTFCAYLAGTLEYEQDPCCNPVLGVEQCCRPTPSFRATEAAVTINTAKINQLCKSPTCIQNTISDFVSTMAANDDPVSGCEATFNDVSSLNALSGLSNFIDMCRVTLVGNDLRGSSCFNDSDCFYGASCNPYTLRCNHTDADVIQCLATNIDSTTATILFNNWGIFQPGTYSALVSQLSTRLKTSQCVGPTAIEYRNSYFYTTQIQGCTDECTAENAAPSCFDRSSSFCVIPPLCDGAQTAGACYRYWSNVVNDHYGCTHDQECNWMSCDGELDCETTCLARTSNICVDCSQGAQCVEVTDITDSARCGLGLCTTNSSAVGEAECFGSCSLSCPSCYEEIGCTQNGECSDAPLLLSLLDASITGACLYPPTYDLDQAAFVCSNSSDTVVPNGCVNGSVFDQASCPTTWYSLATSIDECNSPLRYGCYDSNSGNWLLLNQSECFSCANNLAYSWSPYYQWTNGTWTPGRIQALQWVAPQYGSVNKVQNAIDYTLTFKTIKDAITTQFSYSYYTEAQCLYSVPLQLTATAVCNCDDTGVDPRTCFESAVNVPLGKGRACPYLASNITTRDAMIEIQEATIPPTQGCQVFTLLYTPPTQYKLDSKQSVSQALFRNSPTNPYWIVINHKAAYIGQITSAGISVEWNISLDESFVLCILPDPSIEVARVASELAISQLGSDSSIEVVSIAILNANGMVCGPINNSGTFFASAVVPNFAEETNRASQIEYYIGAAIYLLCFVFGITQAVMLWRRKNIERIFTYKMTFIGIILLNDVIRCVYVLLPPNAFEGGLDSIQFIVFELPTFLYFTVFTVIAYMWFLVVLKAFLWSKRGLVVVRERQIRLGFILANCAMYMVFVVFIYLIAILPEKAPVSPCFFGSSDSATSSITHQIKIAYWIFQAVVVSIVSVGFILAAGLLTRTFFTTLTVATSGDSSRGMRYSAQIVTITTVAVVCIVVLLIRSGLFLYSATTGTTLNVIAFVMLEVVPQTMVLFYVRPFLCMSEHRSASSETMKTRSVFTRSHSKSTMSHSSSHAVSDSSKIEH